MKRTKSNRKHHISEWFEWSPKEQRGMIVLSGLILMLCIYHLIWPYVFHRKKNLDPAFNLAIQNWLTTSIDSIQTEKGYAEKTLDYSKSDYFFFDPNTLDDEGFHRLGISEKQLKSIRNYLNKGGKFRKAEDFSKMYVISESMYAKLSPWIRIETISASSHYFNDSTNVPKENNPFQLPRSSFSKSEKSTTLLVDINQADTSTFKRLVGIGSFLAKKIVEYRERLGGFYSIDQLQEVYRLTPGKLDSLRPQLILNTQLARRWNVNEVTLEILSKHPYLTKAQTKALLAYRDQHGPFKRVEDIQHCALIDDKTFEKIRFYLDVR